MRYVLFISILLVLVTSYFTRLRLSRRRRLVIAVLRTLLLILLILSLFDFQRTKQVRERCTIFVVDCSASVGLEGYAKARAFVTDSRARLSRSEKSGVVLFGANALAVITPGKTGELPELRPDTIDPSRSDLEQALRLAALLFPDGCDRRIVLLSDGCQTDGSALVAAQSLRQAGIPLYTVPVAPQKVRDALVERVAFSQPHVHEGASVEGRIFLRANDVFEGKVKLFQNGLAIQTFDVKLEPGLHPPLVFQRSLDRKGFYQFRAVLEAEGDLRPENNSALGYLDVYGQPLVLLIAGKQSDTRYLRRALEAEKIRVHVRPPAGVPRSLQDVQSYDLIIFSDLAATKMSDSQMELVRLYVSQLGGGFVMIGGENSFGLGGYFKTPIAEILPVELTKEDKEEKATAAVVLALDKSGSMSSAVQGARKIDVVKEAAIEVTEILKPSDRIGVVIFDSNATWLVPMTLAAKKKRIAGIISTLTAGGGTNAYPAVEAAYATLRGTIAKLKHTILLSDGQTSGSGFEELARRMRQDNITVSTVAVGQGAQTQLMEAIATAGGGKYYYTNDMASIPRIFTQDTMKHAGSSVKDDPFKPKLVQHCHALRGIDFAAAPDLLGHVLTRAKEGALVPLVTPANDPLLAYWRIGLGKSVAFTSDCKKWAEFWIKRWPDYPRFWSQLVRDCMRESATARMEAHAELEGSTARITARLMSEDYQFINGAKVEAEIYVARKSALSEQAVKLDTIALHQCASGEYEARFPVRTPGSYVVAVKGEAGCARTGFSYSFSPEYLGLEADRALLRRIAESSGGQAIAQPGDLLSQPIQPVAVPSLLYRYLLASAAILLILDVALRRIESLRDLLPSFRR